jgi:ABC-type transporter Mla subunit MlaD
MRYSRIYFLTISVFTFLLFSCGQDNYNLYILFDNVDGLTVESDVTCNGLKIGKVENLEVLRNKVLATVTIDQRVQIPSSSTFTLQSISLLGGQAITVTLDSTKSTYHVDKDTVYGQIQRDTISAENFKPFIDSLANKIIEIRKSQHNDNK